MGTLSDDLKELRALKVALAQATKAEKAARKAHEEAQFRVLRRMESEDTEGQKVGGYNFTPVRTRVSVMQDRSQFVPWAKENAPDLLVEKEQGLDQKVRQLLDDGEVLPPGVGVYVREYISQTKS